MNPVDKLIDGVLQPIPDVQPTTDGSLYATHSGVLEIAGVKLRCHRLNDGRAVINADDMNEFFGGLL